MSSSLGWTNAQRGKQKESHSPDKNVMLSLFWAYIELDLQWPTMIMSLDFQPGYIQIYCLCFVFFVQRPCGCKLGLCGSTMVVGRPNWRSLWDPWRNGVTSLQVSLMKQSIAVTYSIDIMTCALRVCTWKPHCHLIQDTQSVGMKQMKDNRITYIQRFWDMVL